MRTRCSDAARGRGDVMTGTAPPQPRLVLVETGGGWGPNAHTSLPADVRDHLVQRATAASARVLLIRRPGELTRRRGPWRWYAVDPGAAVGARVVRGTWASGAELLGVVDAVEQQASGEPTAAPAPLDEPLLLVCTHGRKDVCCAVRGRPVAAALARHWPEQTWECSHTGGDRFAANVIVLPDGACYGGVDADGAADVVRRHRDGAPAVEHLRGRIGADRIEQAGVSAALERWSVPWGGARASGPPVAVPVGGDWRAAAQAGQRDDRGEDTSEDSVVARWELDVDVQGYGGWRAVIVERVTAAEQLTCRAPGLGTVRVPEVVTWSPLRA